MAKIIPFPAHTTAPPLDPVVGLALMRQWSAGAAPSMDNRQAALMRARALLAEAEPEEPLAARLAAIEAKLDTLLSKKQRRAS